MDTYRTLHSNIPITTKNVKMATTDIVICRSTLPHLAVFHYSVLVPMTVLESGYYRIIVNIHLAIQRVSYGIHLLLVLYSMYIVWQTVSRMA